MNVHDSVNGISIVITIILTMSLPAAQWLKGQLWGKTVYKKRTLTLIHEGISCQSSDNG